VEQAAFDVEVRVFIFRHFVEQGRPPSVEETAVALRAPAEETAAAYRRLHETHMLVLETGSLDVRMANPLSAVETAFRVEAGGLSWYGSCIWDSLGIPAMLGSDGEVRTGCPDCGEPLRVAVRGGEASAEDGAVVHFAIPARRWWDDIIHT
jgi:hypothetical protein